MDANGEDSLMLELLGEVRQLRAVLGRVADTMMVVNQTCVRVIETVERLDAKVTLMPVPAE